MTKPDHLRALQNKGFTLVELLIVVIILAILAGILVPQFGSATDDAKLSALDTTLANSRAAIDLYYQHHGYYPSSVAASGATCPNSGTAGVATIDTEAAFLEHLSLYTNVAGQACNTSDDAFRYGPYMRKPTMPNNPYTNVDTTLVVTAGALGMTSSVTDGGWKFDNITGQFIADHSGYDER